MRLKDSESQSKLMTTYIKDLIELPERVRRGDFVLRLTEGVTRPEETVAEYVVTPQLVKCFDAALDLIRSALDARSSKAAYLHGSFGSGKSHFMAILNLLLQHNSTARAIPELAPVVSRHNSWTEGKRFLLVPYHMIGAKDMESAILGGYADHVRRLHPDAPTPGVYRAEELFKDAQRLRASMGDEAFFARLNESVSERSEIANNPWGALGEWDATSFESALNAPPKRVGSERDTLESEPRTRLVSKLVDTFFTAARNASEFVNLDDGLSIISRHAHTLGYDALILFLDELILWLATRAGDIAFVNREGPKLSKLVEAQAAARPAPIVSFVARQRDLRELVGQNLPGAERLGFSDILKHWEARFSLITLEDRNLPAIAEKRVLKPKSEAARQEMDEAFRQLQSVRKETMDVLLTTTADPQTFRRIYPFSPALMETLIAVSSLLQRERTALKLMLQLLVAQRDTLKLGDLVPVGDLFDVISQGDEAFSDVMKIHFENAMRLWEGKLRPLLEHEHGLRFEDAAKSPDEPKAAALRNDARLVKTLLLSALAENVESLKGLTASRLAALNHGTIKLPIPGRETQHVTSKLRKWAAEVGQIKVGEENNPTVSLQLTGVDTESILAQAGGEDNTGNRIRKIKELLFKALGVAGQDQLFARHEFTWRATKRSCEVTFANVRELPDNELQAPGDEWRVVIDYPFDTEEGRTPKDDVTRLERFRLENAGVKTRTLAWIPSFFSRSALGDLGTLIRLDHVLTGERFDSYAAHLAPVDRSIAKTLLENQRSQLRQRIVNFLEGAYAIATPVPNSIDTTYELAPAEHFQTLDESFNLQPPVGANLNQAFTHLLTQALQHQYPAHPQFESDLNITLPLLKRVFAEIARVAQSSDGHASVERERRKEVRAIANPLRLGDMTEIHFVLGQDWQRHFLRKEAEHGGALTVARLRAWIDEPVPMGLPRVLQNLIILTFAQVTNRSFFQYNAPIEATLENLPETFELREQQLPAQADWERASELAQAIFGIEASPLLSAASAASFVAKTKERATELKPACDQLFDCLKRILPKLSPQGTAAPRFKTAHAAKVLLDNLLSAEVNALIETLAAAELPASAEVIGSHAGKASGLVQALDAFALSWELLEATDKLTDERAAAAAAIREGLVDAFAQDELVTPLAPRLQDAQSRAVRLLADVPKHAAAGRVTPPPLPKPTAPNGTRRLIAHGTQDEIKVSDFEQLVVKLRAALETEEGARLRMSWEIYK